MMSEVDPLSVRCLQRLPETNAIRLARCSCTHGLVLPSVGRRAGGCARRPLLARLAPPCRLIPDAHRLGPFSEHTIAAPMARQYGHAAECPPPLIYR